jgi:hypothetical protein
VEIAKVGEKLRVRKDQEQLRAMRFEASAKRRELRLKRLAQNDQSPLTAEEAKSIARSIARDATCTASERLSALTLHERLSGRLDGELDSGTGTTAERVSSKLLAALDKKRLNILLKAAGIGAGDDEAPKNSPEDAAN